MSSAAYELTALRPIRDTDDGRISPLPPDAEAEAALTRVADERGYRVVKGLTPTRDIPFNAVIAVGDEHDVPISCVAMIVKKETESPEDAQKARSAKYGIAIKAETNVSMPGKWADAGATEADFLDPPNFKYPCIDAVHTRNAAARLAQNEGDYSTKERAILEKRLEAKKKKFDVAQDDGDGEGDTNAAKALRPFSLWEAKESA